MSSTEPVSQRTILSFAAAIGAALVVIALYFRAHGAGTARWATLLCVVGGLMFFALAAPRVLVPFYRVWMRIGEAMAWVNTRVLLTLVFFLVITPTGLLMRLLGRSPLSSPERDSYWIDAEAHSYGDRHVEKQF